MYWLYCPKPHSRMNCLQSQLNLHQKLIQTLVLKNYCLLHVKFILISATDYEDPKTSLKHAECKNQFS